MHLAAQLLAAALVAVPLASSAPLSNTQTNNRRQLTGVLETAGDVIGPPLYDLKDELLHPTLPILDDTVDDVLDIFGRSEKSNTKNKPRQWEWLPPGRYTEETVGRVIDVVEPVVDGVGETVGNVGDYLQYGLPGKQKRDDDKKWVVVKVKKADK